MYQRSLSPLLTVAFSCLTLLGCGDGDGFEPQEIDQITVESFNLFQFSAGAGFASGTMDMRIFAGECEYLLRADVVGFTAGPIIDISYTTALVPFDFEIDFDDDHAFEDLEGTFDGFKASTVPGVGANFHNLRNNGFSIPGEFFFTAGVGIGIAFEALGMFYDKRILRPDDDGTGFLRTRDTDFCPMPYGIDNTPGPGQNNFINNIPVNFNPGEF